MSILVPINLKHAVFQSFFVIYCLFHFLCSNFLRIALGSILDENKCLNFSDENKVVEFVEYCPSKAILDVYRVIKTIVPLEMQLADELVLTYYSVLSEKKVAKFEGVKPFGLVFIKDFTNSVYKKLGLRLKNYLQNETGLRRFLVKPSFHLMALNVREDVTKQVFSI